jgi:SAM-dependent methyltransferase
MLLKSFAEENRNKTVVDLGCGPGQTTKILKDCGVKKILGIDLSPVMAEKAAFLNKGIKFETGDVLNLKYADGYFGAAVAFYSIVHFTYPYVRKAFNEINRVLKKNGQFLFSFHIGNGKVHLQNLLTQSVDIDFYFFETEKIFSLLSKTGFKIITALERFPYPNIEYQSKRAYILARKAD